MNLNKLYLATVSTAWLALAPPSGFAGEIGEGVHEAVASGVAPDIIVEMSGTADLDGVPEMGDRVSRLEHVRNTLTDHADASQAEVRRLLSDMGQPYTVLWINNSISVENADADLIAQLAEIPAVAKIRLEGRVELDPMPAEPLPGPDLVDAEWGNALIGAPDLWARGISGEGVVVANIDTGVRHTHEALRAQYRGNLGGGSYNHNYNWWDPSKVCHAQGAVPCDNNNHGTHTMGTMVGGDGTGPGDNDIGVAPGAKWIAAKGCETNSCSETALVSSAQWALCPTRTNGSQPDCSKAPHVVNNSWGGGRGDDWYMDALYPLVKAGIIPVFSAGNAGPNCGTAGSPGDYPYIVSVGATDSNDVLASFSSRGPGAFTQMRGRFKPTISAPGVSVRSAIASSDAAYGSLSGTSMAAPHVAGTVALLLDADPGASIQDIYRALHLTTEQSLGNPSGGPDSCDGRDYDDYPSYHYGFGRLDALQAVNAITGE